MAIYLLPFGLFATLALLYQSKMLRLGRVFYGLALLALSLFAGLRFEVGQDWPAYVQFFDELNLKADFLDLYGSGTQQFELGYYLLNYAVKAFGGTYSIVFLVSSLFLSYALYTFTKRFLINRFYVLTIYVGYTFLILNFAQVRQAIAVGFFLLGCNYYLCHQRRVISLAVASIGILFQYSALLYVAILFGVLCWPQKRQILWASTVTSVVGLVLYLVSKFSDFYAVLGLLSSASAAEKVAIYKEIQEDQGGGQLWYAAYLLLLVWYLIRYKKVVKLEQIFIVNFAIASLLTTIVFIYIFPGSYVLYSRAYVVACIFQACAMALIFSRKNGTKHAFCFFITIAVAAIYNLRILSINVDDFVPYKSVAFLNLL
ncbi:MAG: EpsG family protein [Steroidobacteraceae bacterium]